MTTNYHTPLPTGAGATTGNLNTVFSSLDSAITDLLKGDVAFNQLRFAAATTLTIASGVVTASRTFHKIDTQGAAASDDLDTVSGGQEGDLLFLRAANTTRTVVLKHATGNLYMASGADLSLDSTETIALLIHNGTYWIGLGGGGAIDASGVTYTPAVLADWSGAADPGNSDDALDQLADRVTTLEGAGGGYYLKYAEQQTAGTANGTFTSGAWRTRPFNTEVRDSGAYGSIASNQITLAAGTYRFLISVPAYIVASHVSRLQNITAGTTTAVGTAEYCAAAGLTQTRSFIAGEFTIAASTVFEVQHYCTTTRTTNGMGVAANVGVTEVYGIAEFWKVA